MAQFKPTFIKSYTDVKLPLWLALAGALCISGLPGRADEQPRENNTRAAATNPQYQMIEREITFTGAGGAQLAGTVALPVAAMPNHRTPGVVLIAGSGPTDRDGNQGDTLRTDLLKQIAHYLAGQGIVSLRYDKRGIGGSKVSLDLDTLSNTERLSAFFTWENFVTDAAAALQALQRQPEIDRAHTGLIGHSEGGSLALQAAQSIMLLGNPEVEKNGITPPQLLVLISTPGRPLDEILQEQIGGLLKRQQATPEQTTKFLQKNREITTAIRETGVVPADVPPGLAPLYPAYLGKFLQSAFRAEPAKLAAAFNGPVLVLQGERDIQVSAERDAPALDTALKSRTGDDHTLFIVPGASHNLKILKDDSDPGLTGIAAPDALQKLGEWLASKFTG